ncbi:metalloregulator ArsR/SmtB family transcription factor [Sediminibacillus dalangtanensis]|uniref:Metalloregulator ArsR/SmtB family transcription factor n=1 Tax=Sediminibacillus dalangtanensis TaxID=2729421 RepID=A0ABX7VUU4_9BACI|nr:metalloregulator ArsR/SmtB family transcription factor [Sediminibacillus dalangtanensis]QTN00309.1 metalloregulator ArsR/SmtB family transcription factor [Sediminibacillus dalangtanensis]
MNQTLLNTLAEPNRFRIVEYLKEGPRTVGEISDHLQIRQPQASKHLRVLNEAKIVEVQAEANRRIYKLRPEPFYALEEWLVSYRNIWEDRFERLDTYFSDLQKKNGEND